MKRTTISAGRRTGMKALCAAGSMALVALLTGCGGGGGGSDALAPAPGPAPGSPGGGGTPAREPGITVVAGSADESGSADGKGAAARFNSPRGIAIDASGNLYVADGRNNAIRKIAPDGQVFTLVGANAGLTDPIALTIDGSGNLFVTEQYNIRKVAPGGAVTTAATITRGTGGDGRSAALFLPAGIAVDATGNLLVTNGIGTRRINPAGATTMLEGEATRDNLFGTQTLNPRGVAVDAGGMVYVADLRATISRAAATANSLTTFVGTPDAKGHVDGAGAAARFERVVGLTVDKQGNLFAADSGINNLIRKITPDGVVTTVAGQPGSPLLKTGALPGSLSSLGGVVADGNGNLYATSGHAVVKITLP